MNKAINVQQLMQDILAMDKDKFSLLCTIISDKLVCEVCQQAPVWLCTYEEKLFCSEHLQKACSKNSKCPGCYGGYEKN